MAEPGVPASQIADAESCTPEQIFSFSIFSSPDDLYEHTLAILSTVTSDQELIYKDVPPLWAQTILNRLESRSKGSFRLDKFLTIFLSEGLQKAFFICIFIFIFTEKTTMS